MKAVFIVDIPEDYTGSVISVNLYGGNNKLIHETYVNELRLLPKRKLHVYEQVDDEYGYVEGWNACLDAITGEDDEV